MAFPPEKAIVSDDHLGQPVNHLGQPVNRADDQLGVGRYQTTTPWAAPVHP